MDNKENPLDACYTCKHVGKMNKNGNITCNILKIEAEPYYWCHRFEKKTDPNQYIALKLTLYDVPLREIEEAYTFIEANLDDIQTYYLHPEPGRPMAAAFDYTLILTAVEHIASIYTVAEIIWKVYNKFIGSRNVSPKDDAGIYLGIPLPNGEIMTLSVGSNYKDKNIFIEAFVDYVGKLKQDPESFRLAINIKSEVENDRNWVKRK